MGHLARTCWSPGGGGDRPIGTTSAADETFSGVGDKGLKNPPRVRVPRKETLLDRVELKWCGLCESWTNHYRAGYPAESAEEDEGVMW